MIVLDTNVISEPMRKQGSAAVIAWLDAQVAETLFLTATSLSELHLGTALIPPGSRRAGLEVALRKVLDTLFADRILAFDAPAARMYADRMSAARAHGSAVSVSDGQIGAIAATHGFAVATRDAGPFIALGVRVIDPWTDA